MSIIEQRFQSFITRVRPHRVAVFVNVDDIYWQHSCLGIIEFFTKLWGGSHCVIIPTDGNKIDEVFWAILSSHDPDFLYNYQPTGADLKIRAPDEFNRLVAAEVAKRDDGSGFADEWERAAIEKGITEAEVDPWTLTDELRRELLMRLAPFHFDVDHSQGTGDRRLFIPDITRGSKPHHPLTLILDVLKGTEKPKNVTQLVWDVEKDAAPPPLWLAATIGAGDEKYFSDMNSINIVPQPVHLSQQDISQVIKWGISPRTHLEASFPMGLTRAALIPVMSTASRRHELQTVVVVGDSLKDFCLFQALYWQQGRALWLPTWFMPEGNKYPDRLMRAIREAEESARYEHSESLSLVSFSVPKAKLDELKAAIHPHSFKTKVSVDEISTAMVKRQLEYPSRVFADGNMGDVTTHLLLNDNLPGWFESPLPRMLHPANPLLHRWMVDITFMQHLLPRHLGLGRIVVSGPNVEGARAGRECVSYMCPGIMVMGDHMETNMLRPSIHVPSAEEIFRVILDECGYESKTSDKGRYEAETVRKFGGLESAGLALASAKHRALLIKFLDDSKPKTGVYDEGVYLKDMRRYLNFASISKVLGGGGLACQLIDDWIEKGILYRGYVFRCENCSDVAWHSISDVDQTFTCKRCSVKQQYRLKTWRHPDEPSWFYKLDEMVYLMLENNGYVPVLTLNKLRTRSKDSFLFTPEVHLTPKGETKMYLEIDVCCVANGRLCIGEAKSNDSLAGTDLTALETVARYRDLALKTSASIVVFATAKHSWDPASSNAIVAAFEAHPHIEIVRMTATDLYS